MALRSNHRSRTTGQLENRSMSSVSCIPEQKSLSWWLSVPLRNVHLHSPVTSSWSRRSDIYSIRRLVLFNSVSRYALLCTVLNANIQYRLERHWNLTFTKPPYEQKFSSQNTFNENHTEAWFLRVYRLQCSITNPKTSWGICVMVHGAFLWTCIKSKLFSKWCHVFLVENYHKCKSKSTGTTVGWGRVYYSSWMTYSYPIDLALVVLQGGFMTQVYHTSVFYQSTEDCFSLLPSMVYLLTRSHLRDRWHFLGTLTDRDWFQNTAHIP